MHALTIARLHAFSPRVIVVRVNGIAALFEPSTTTSATTEFAGFLENTALGTTFTSAYRGCNRRRGCFYRYG